MSAEKKYLTTFSRPVCVIIVAIYMQTYLFSVNTAPKGILIPTDSHRSWSQPSPDVEVVGTRRRIKQQSVGYHNDQEVRRSLSGWESMMRNVCKATDQFQTTSQTHILE